MDQNFYKLFDMINEKVSKDEIAYTGFESLYGNLQIRPPTMQMAHGDLRTINVYWIPPLTYTNTSHYLIQVSDDNITWRGLRFDGGDFGYIEGSVTTVFSTNIAHTRIPFLDGGIRILYYRGATVSKDGNISEWSDSISANTFFIEAGDVRGSDFIFGLQGTITLDSNFDTGQFSYDAVGSVSLSGSVSWDGWFDYVAYIGDVTISSSSNFIFAQYLDVDGLIGSGRIKAGALIWRAIDVSYYLVENTWTSSLSFADIINVRNGTPHTVVLPAGSMTKHYGQPTPQMIALKAAYYCDYNQFNEDYF